MTILFEEHKLLSNVLFLITDLKLRPLEHNYQTFLSLLEVGTLGVKSPFFVEWHSLTNYGYELKYFFIHQIYHNII